MIKTSCRISGLALCRSQQRSIQSCSLHFGLQRAAGIASCRKIRLFTGSRVCWYSETSESKRTILQNTERRPGVTDSLKPEVIQPKSPAVVQKQNDFMSEKTVSNKEQRKADWAIIREMSRYLWPKVFQSSTVKFEFKFDWISLGLSWNKIQSCTCPWAPSWR